LDGVPSGAAPTLARAATSAGSAASTDPVGKLTASTQSMFRRLQTPRLGTCGGARIRGFGVDRLRPENVCFEGHGATAGHGPNSVIPWETLQAGYCLCPLPVSKSTSASKNTRTAGESWANVARIAIAASMLIASRSGRSQPRATAIVVVAGAAIKLPVAGALDPDEQAVGALQVPSIGQVRAWVGGLRQLA